MVANNPAQTSWNDKTEKGNLFLLSLASLLYRYLGRRVFLLVLPLIIFWYWLFSPKTRQYSYDYLNKVYQFSNQSTFDKAPNYWHTYRHLNAFGVAIVDKMAGWLGQIDEQQLSLFGHLHLQACYGKGAVLVVSHFGNIELLRAVKSNHRQPVNVLVYQKHAEKFNAFLKKLNPKAGVRLISVADLGVQTAIFLQERLDAGEWVIVAGDRVPVDSARSQAVWFLGQQAYFPEGVWHLAHLLNAPVLAVFCYAYQGKFEVHIEPLSQNLTLPRQNRATSLQMQIQQYADLLAKHCLRSPYQWFNFYDFWQVIGKK